jgi:hypothetical protein
VQETVMTKKKMMLRIIAALLMALSLSALNAGCWDISDIFSSSEADPDPGSSNEVQNQNLQLPDGYQMLSFDLTTVFGGSVPESLSVQQLVLNNEGGAVYFQNPLSQEPDPLEWWHGVVIDPEDINEDVLIEIAISDLEHGILDFSPHPYQFQNDIELEFSYAFSNLILLGFSPQDLVIMYWDENSETWQAINFELRESEQKIIAYTDHFSRYVIAVGRGSY